MDCGIWKRLAFVMQNATKPVKSLARVFRDVSNRTRPGGNATLKMIGCHLPGQQTYASSRAQSGTRQYPEDRTT